ncbi:MAG TPA: endo-1,4-beta-xylanase [Tepidisphaeraceae bacterium]|jgi:GH35 family endo-1,4-beta-xylanase|nr:endo-1,4-beta-xylanase [Tepidisphaeraceae bacterium]
MRKLLTGCVIAAATANVVSAQVTSLTGTNLALKSGTSTLGSNGYVGTYLVVPTGGATVNFTINSTEGSTGTGTPHMQLVVADSTASFSINNTSATNYTTSNMTLPAGTYFVRDERDYSGNAGVTKSLTVNNLSVNTVTGGVATFSNSSTDNTLALAASNTYISNFRQGPGTVALTGPGNVPLLAGTSVQVDMARNAFNFGGTASGVSQGDVKDMLISNPGATTEAHQFQSFINQYFNTIVPSNGGKWASNEPTQNNLTMQLVDEQLNYAQAHNMRARMHNLLWGSGSMAGNQQPGFVNTLIASAAGGNVTSASTLRTDISNRINYYAGTNGNRSDKYIEMDVLNEALNNPAYWNIYGAGSGTTNNSANGIAGIYNEVAQAAAAAGNPNLKLYTNEFNVLQFSPATISTAGAESGSDAYANWYRNEVESLRNANGAVSGIGMQLYASVTATGGNALSTATMQKALQNLSVEGLPLTMAEFGLASGNTAASNQSLGPAALENAMRMMYGTPDATTFMIWGWWDTATSIAANGAPPAQMIVTTPGSSTYTLTAIGQKWVDLMNAFSTHLTGVNAPIVDANGNITFNGFYGDYNIGAQSGFSNLTLAKGTSQYNLQLAAPPNWSLWNTSNSGSWSSGGNWSTGGVASAAGQTAYFGTAAAPRTITVDGARTVGMIALNSANSYTIGGAGTVTLQGFNSTGGHQAAIYVAGGSHRIDAPLAPADNTTITVAPANSTLTITQLQPSNVTISTAGAGTVAVNNIRAAGLNVGAGTVKVLPDGTNAATSTIGSLAIAGATDAWSARLDLANNHLIVNYTGTSPLATIQNQIKNGASSAWTGKGIISSSAASVAIDGSNLHKTALGFGEASTLDLSTFAGQPITGPAIVVGYTLIGDANLDGVVNLLDLNALASNFGATTGTWTAGDFDYNSAVDINDFNSLALNFNASLPASSPAPAALVPEPAVIAILPIVSLLARRRSRRFNWKSDFKGYACGK